VNHGGVMPIIFAQSLMLFPGVAFGWLDGVLNKGQPAMTNFGSVVHFLNEEFGRGAFLLHHDRTGDDLLLRLLLERTVQFQPKEMANQLRDYGSFIPGLRPGKRTADYLEK
jgi:preprotein translocase subunit SecY